MALHIHAVMQDPADFDDARILNSIQQEMTTASAVTGDV